MKAAFHFSTRNAVALVLTLAGGLAGCSDSTGRSAGQGDGRPTPREGAGASQDDANAAGDPTGTGSPEVDA